MILERFKITDKVAIVTGGTRGIGLAIAHALGEAGAKLVVTSRTDKFGGLDSLKEAGHDVSFFESDITDKSVPQKITSQTFVSAKISYLKEYVTGHFFGSNYN